MAQGPTVPSELSRRVLAFARALVAGARTSALYPPEHPAVQTSVQRFVTAVREACRHESLAFGVAPQGLILDGELTTDKPIDEAAAWLHARDVLHLAVEPGVSDQALAAFLTIAARDPGAIREAGGPRCAWDRTGLGGLQIEQIDFGKVLETIAEVPASRRRDDIWHSLVRAVIERRATADAAVQRRLLDVAGDVQAIGDLAADVMAPNCTADGSPMLTSQAAAVLAAYRHLMGIIELMAPDRRAEILRNLAASTAYIDSRVVLEMVSQAAADAHGDAARDLGRTLAATMDENEVATLLARTLALDGRATARLASVFETLAPDDDRKRRVLSRTRTLLAETALGGVADFQAIWTATEELLLSYTDKPFVSSEYRDSLDRIGERAEQLASDGVPDDLRALVATLEHDNVRRLSVVLLIDLLNLEQDATEASALARDLAAACEDLLLAGDYDTAAIVTAALEDHAVRRTAPGVAGARVALDGLAATPAFREACGDLGAVDDAAASTLARVCRAVGPPAVDALLALLESDRSPVGRERAAAIVRDIGPAGLGRLASLVGSAKPFAQRQAAELLGAVGTAAAVPLLQPLLRAPDPDVTRAAVRALSTIEDPSAARCVHTVLRAATGDLRRTVVAALVEERDPRVVPLLGRILDESDALGADHAVVLETLGAVATLGADAVVPAVDRVMRQRRWFAGPKVRAVTEASIRSLRQIGTPAAVEAIARAASGGDRPLRRAARLVGPA